MQVWKLKKRSNKKKAKSTKKNTFQVGKSLKKTQQREESEEYKKNKHEHLR